MMQRSALGCLSVATLGVGLAIVASCSDKDISCKVDTDCPQGNICRDEVCGPVTGDASAPSTPASEASPPTTCLADGVACTASVECCSSTCASGQCASSAPPPCKGALEICQGDCCPGLSCVSGACK